MVFSSLSFLMVFLPIVVILYYIVPGIRAKNVILLLVSLLFYSFGEPYYVLLLLANTFVNYIMARAIAIRKHKKLYLGIGIGFDLITLGIFKYLNFLLSGLALVGIDWSIKGLAFPIGISFYTFQIMSYTIDVYRDKNMSQRNFSKLLLYICFFPQLIAGPIVKYHDIRDQFDHRETSPTALATGLRRFIYGLAKKVLIANQIGYMVDGIYGFQASEFNMITGWAVALLYCLQIYYDFSGYSDMAIGLGKMFGFHIKENFDYPYEATSITEFWQGWHISLSTWFKEYLYIPLGGNRKGKKRMVINKFLVFFATGLWHGAGINFILWGLVHGLFASLEGMGTWANKIRGKVIGHIYMIVVVAVTFVLFRSPTIATSSMIISKMFTGYVITSQSMSQFMTYLNPYAILIVCLSFIGIVNWKVRLKRLADISWIIYGTYVISGVLYIGCILSLVSSSYNPFIYFRF